MEAEERLLSAIYHELQKTNEKLDRILDALSKGKGY
jgi:hypothetical protein